MMEKMNPRRQYHNASMVYLQYLMGPMSTMLAVRLLVIWSQKLKGYYAMVEQFIENTLNIMQRQS